MVSNLYTTLTSLIFLALIFIATLLFSDRGYADPSPTAPDTGTVLVFGDSVSAAYGMEQEQGWVYLLTKRLAAKELDYQVINASVSGETTGGGVVRLPKTLQIHQPNLVVLELGGNDGLRGYPIDKIRQNLSVMVDSILTSGADVLLVGMVLPPNYGRRYTKAFEDLFAQVATQFDIPFLPFLLEGVATSESLLQRDGIHPTPEAQAMLLDDLWPLLEAELTPKGSGQQ
ncbi:MAG: arylesterase [Gammaproteobacteria bacterium]|jgi:acyl-CoA thioesterase-1|nr:arylesterase [Gammaproteobacteria bacterium]